MYNPKESSVQVRSCLPQTPSIAFDEGTNDNPRKPMVINPNLPQSNEFTAYGYFPVKSIPKEYFKLIYREGTNPVPTSPFLEELNKITFSASFDDVADEKASISTLLKRTFSAFFRIDEVSYVLPKTETTTVLQVVRLMTSKKRLIPSPTNRLKCWQMKDWRTLLRNFCNLR